MKNGGTYIIYKILSFVETNDILKTLGYFAKTIFIKWRESTEFRRPANKGPAAARELNSARRVLASRGVGSLASYRSPESA